MKKNTKINSEQDIRAVFYIIDYIMDSFFPTFTVLGDEEFKQIVNQITEDYNRVISKSTIERFFNIRTKPHPISYKKLDDIVYWCFSGKYDSYKDLLKENKETIFMTNLISNKEIQSIIDKLQTKKIIIANNEKEVNTSEGVVANLLEITKLIVGDLQAIKDTKNETYLIANGSKRIAKRLILKEQRRQENIEKIIDKAIDFIKSKEKSNKRPYEDWIIDFFDIAQDCSDEKMQYLWAKLLAGEVSNPGDFSRRTLQRIKEMTQYEALIFEYISRCMWLLKDEYNGDQMILILDDNHFANHYFDETFEFNGSDINNLENLGLIKLSYIELTKDENYSLSFFGLDHVLGAKLSHQEFSFAALTPSGEEILSLIDANPNTEYYKKTLEFLKKKNILIK